MLKRLFVIALGLLSAVMCAHADQAALDAVMESRTQLKPMPAASSLIPGLTMERAYAIQRGLTDLLTQKGDAIAGFKSALTNAEMQKRFGVETPICAPLFKSGAEVTGAVIEMKAFVKPFIEQEIGYTVAERISEPVRDVDELKKKIKDVFPAVELPDIRFADMKTLKGPDLVADAVSSAKYITGNRLPFGAVDPNVQEVTLTRDGKEINRGPASDVLGDQYKALMSLVNCAVSQGRVIEPGHVLITGAVGAMIPGTPGVYEGAWGALGTVAWTMK